MQHSGFFNSQIVGGVPDRRYNADDYRKNLAVIIGNGVLRSDNNDLLVTAHGMAVSVGVGRAWINGAYFLNDAEHYCDAVSAPAVGSRIDRVMLRFDNSASVRDIHLVYVTGTAAASPVAPAPTRAGNIYDLVLADVTVNANATSVVVTDKRGDNTVCGWVYSVVGDSSFFTSLDASFNTWFQSARDTLSSVSLFKRYNWRSVLTSATNTVAFNIPQYDANTCFIEVFVNGIVETETTDYTQSANVLTFSGTLVAGTEVEVKCYKSIDGTGIMSVSDEITELQNQYATLAGVSNFTYKCTGLNDNISLSEIAQAFETGSYVAANVSAAAAAFLSAIGGNTYLAAMSSEAQVTINVVGRLGATTPFYGTGTSANRYRWFSFGLAASNDKRIIFDFAKCEKITIACSSSKDNIIFYGTDCYIKNANVYAYCNGNSCPIEMIAGSANTGRIEAENCRFSISTSGLAVIAENGTFINCFGKVVSRSSNAFCFAPKTDSLVQIIGGTFFAYIAASGMTPAIIYIYNTETNAVAIAHNINCPTVALTGFSQLYIAVAGAGNIYISGVVSTMNCSGSTVTVAGQIWKSKR